MAVVAVVFFFYEFLRDNTPITFTLLIYPKWPLPVLKVDRQIAINKAISSIFLDLEMNLEGQTVTLA